MTYIKATFLSAVVGIIFFALGYATAERDIYADALKHSSPESCESRQDPINCLITSL